MSINFVNLHTLTQGSPTPGHDPLLGRGLFGIGPREWLAGWMNHLSTELLEISQLVGWGKADGHIFKQSTFLFSRKACDSHMES